ncbi:extracellular solute-binding protein [Spirochaetia bacterium 38H-sp]|uniref:Extracellular solute-binding protein n=1 Tax=Rarispira pelagica TaxID=3141764 RepID=A0ABU9UA61_9SPIR
MKRFVAFFIVLLLCSVYLFAGPQAEGSSGSVLPFDPEKIYDLRIGLFPDLSTSYPKDWVSDEFKKMYPNINLEVVEGDWDGHHDRLVSVIAAGEGACDIEAIDEGFLGQLKGGFVDLYAEPFNAASVTDKIVAYGINNGTKDGRLIAVPVDTSPVVLFYRKDVADEVGVSFENLSSYRDFIEIGKKVVKDTNGDGEMDRFLFANALEFSLIPLNNGVGCWVDEQGRVMEPREKFIELLNLVKEAADAGVCANLEEWSDPWAAAYGNGTVVARMEGAWFEGSLNSWMAPDLSGKWRVTYLPGNAKVNAGGTYLGVPSQTSVENQAAAWEVIKFLTTMESAQGRHLKEIGAFPVLKSLYDSPIMGESVEYFGGQAAHKVAADVAKQIPVLNPGEYDQAARGIWQNVVANVIAGTMTVEEAYESAKQNIEALMD